MNIENSRIQETFESILNTPKFMEKRYLNIFKYTRCFIMKIKMILLNKSNSN
ncbi:unnamed protein product [Paramecium sonneborni]|uniref:Uncharacterized protein n=1 Tax=Paramecium sonneborni TaxID=65129 RepID=A0A8S1QP96_9CILI|nr:unnamed protein product [Paramecium sonneborni]